MSDQGQGDTQRSNVRTLNFLKDFRFHEKLASNVQNTCGGPCPLNGTSLTQGKMFKSSFLVSSYLQTANNEGPDQTEDVTVRDVSLLYMF